MEFKVTTPENGVSAVVLGIMQDGGLPHAGCRCPRCAAAFDNPALARTAACLAIVDARTTPAGVWVIDATPDIGRQLNALAPALGPHPTQPQRLRRPDGLFLTHAHMGHIAGLPQLGMEVMAVDALPVFASDGLCQLLEENELWRPMVGRLALQRCYDGRPVQLANQLKITPLSVPHRDEWGVGTFAFRIQGPHKSLLYLPDIDAWEQWPEAREQVAAVDWALVDGSFYSTAELNGRPPAAHPLVLHTLEFFGDLSHKLVFTHLNHTNPVLDAGSLEYTEVERTDAGVAGEGQMFVL